jgi:PIN domain nuclease of toxin-antitoxin system
VDLLVDTQALLWFVGDDPLLTTTARDALENPDNDLAVSIATFWEIAIKLNLRKLTLRQPFHAFIERVTDYYGMQVMPISTANAEMVATLPLHHKDPFDRIIAAQALAVGDAVVSADRIFDLYAVPRIW